MMRDARCRRRTLRRERLLPRLPRRRIYGTLREDAPQHILMMTTPRPRDANMMPFCLMPFRLLAESAINMLRDACS